MSISGSLVRKACRSSVLTTRAPSEGSAVHVSLVLVLVLVLVLMKLPCTSYHDPVRVPYNAPGLDFCHLVMFL